MIYILEIRDPSDKDCSLAHLKSSEPFMTFNVGDTIHGQSIPVEGEMAYPHNLVITEIEHFIFTIRDTIHHNVMLYTKVK
ncbi:hypothetical protein B9475_002380 [Proteus mirabilis]|uniref:hypothetical protein n=1 Tax=Proteus terrae TaxID=1574161 RepID=UPI000B411D27|nr:hypothetical protein B9475_002380 [Proteus mirabilis]